MASSQVLSCIPPLACLLDCDARCGLPCHPPISPSVCSALESLRAEHLELVVPSFSSIQVFYGIGVAIIAEGAFSAIYHVCPSLVNYQFDVSLCCFIVVFAPDIGLASECDLRLSVCPGLGCRLVLSTTFARRWSTISST